MCDLFNNVAIMNNDSVWIPSLHFGPEETMSCHRCLLLQAMCHMHLLKRYGRFVLFCSHFSIVRKLIRIWQEQNMVKTDSGKAQCIVKITYLPHHRVSQTMTAWKI
jgi:glutamate racemase